LPSIFTSCRFGIVLKDPLSGKSENSKS